MNGFRFFPHLLAVLMLSTSVSVMAGPEDAQRLKREQVVKHWSAWRRATATPRDLRIDADGRAYLRKANGVLVPYGQERAGRPEPAKGKPPGAGGGNGGGGGGSDDGGGSGGGSGGPAISNMDPAVASEIGSTHLFKARVEDPDGIKSVVFSVRNGPGGLEQTFRPSLIGDPADHTWGITLSGFSGGSNWQWWVTAKDGTKKGGNTTVSDVVQFSVSAPVANSPWTDGGDVQTAAGRIYFEMPDTASRSNWSGYVCSGTVVTELETDRSVILTAAHCVYDDANKAFARNVLFIPNQAGTSGAGTDLNCSNDPVGCWVPSFGVVDRDWTGAVFPDNIEWDYAYYVVDNVGAHTPGLNPSNDALDATVASMDTSFSEPVSDASDNSDFTHALGYSYSEDPNFMYCAEGMTTNGAVNWWLPSCLLSGGSSGGPWVQPMDAGTGSGPVISVNSWGYVSAPGMAGPKLSSTSAFWVFSCAKLADLTTVFADGDAGFVFPAPDPDQDTNAGSCQ